MRRAPDAPVRRRLAATSARWSARSGAGRAGASAASGADAAPVQRGGDARCSARGACSATAACVACAAGSRRASSVAATRIRKKPSRTAQSATRSGRGPTRSTGGGPARRRSTSTRRGSDGAATVRPVIWTVRRAAGGLQRRWRVARLVGRDPRAAGVATRSAGRGLERRALRHRSPTARRRRTGRRSTGGAIGRHGRLCARSGRASARAGSRSSRGRPSAEASPRHRA
jgi:hypothetical protein